MSRVGRKEISIPNEVKVQVDGNNVRAEGPKGSLDIKVPIEFKVTHKDNTIAITRPSDEKRDIALHGLYRSLVNNMIIGVSKGYVKELEIQGVGYKAQAQPKSLTLALGFSHKIDFLIPEGITIKTPKPTHIIVEGFDKKLVGEVAATIRSYHRPEPYKGKGIRYKGEYVRRKAGKAVV